MRAKLVQLFLVAICIAPYANAKPSPASVDARREALKKLIAEEWEFEMRQSPVAATFYGDYRFNSKLDDFSIAATLRQEKAKRKFLARLATIDTTGFPEQEQLNKTLLERKLQQDVADIELKNYEMPLDQFNGLHLLLAQFPAAVPTDTVKQFDDYLARLRQVPRVIDQVIVLARLGEKDRLVPPQYVLSLVRKQCEQIAASEGDLNPFVAPLKKLPGDLPAGEQARIRSEVNTAVDRDVRSAYTKLAHFVLDEYEANGRTDPGIWALPDGDARYRNAIREMTTTDLTPQQIYEIGMAGVKESEAQMAEIAKKQGYPDWQSYAKEIETNAKYRAKSRDDILNAYRADVDQMRPKLPQLFGLLPKERLEVVAVEPYREKEAAGASYFQGTPDGARTGKVYVNTGDFEHRELPEVEATAYHEGIPGHHMQISIAQELPDLPPFRQHAGFDAYIEGWALYAERLGKELGFYQDPASDFERVASDLFRSARLVEDTGVHYKHWTREQMVQFFQDNSMETGDDLQAEVDRYIVWPGQACSYKLGQLKILELRKRAQDQLGDKFDIRAFHDQILGAGSLPLDVLDARANAWIASVKASVPSKTGR